MIPDSYLICEWVSAALQIGQYYNLNQSKMDQNYLQDEPDHSSSQSEDEVSIFDPKQPIKAFMPQQYNKAKRHITKMVNNFFTTLREEVKAGAKLHLNRSKFQDIEAAITAYVGLRYNDKKVSLDLKRVHEQSKSKQNKVGLLSYVSESEKIISYSNTGKVNVLQLHKDKYKIPDIATPVAFEKCVYFLDPCNYDTKKKMFVPQGPAFCATSDGKIKEIPEPIFFRTRCGVVRKGEEVYLIGGEATERKVLTNRCEKYNLKTFKSEELPPMKHKHRTPSVCFLGQNLWVFSLFQTEMFDGNEWFDIGIPFGGRFLPFQYTIPINDHEILIFGGVNNNEKSRQVKIYSTKYKKMNYYGELLPQGMSTERNSGASVVHGCVAALSSIQASVYPQVGVISNMTEVVYLFENSAFLNSIITL